MSFSQKYLIYIILHWEKNNLSATSLLEEIQRIIFSEK